MGVFQDAIAGGLAAIRGAAGVSIVYRRAGASLELAAVSAETQFVQQDGEAVVARYRSRDYLIAIADLELEGSTIVPEEGDRITETINGTACEFEVASEGGEPAYRYSDRAQTQFRVHTKQVG